MIQPGQINVLIACEESQTECMAFRRRGFQAFSCDIQPCAKNKHPEWHILGDVTPYLDGMTTFITQDGETHHVEKWHMIIAHPPCTYLSKVGSRWLYQEPIEKVFCEWLQVYVCVNLRRWQKLVEARDFFFRCLNAKADFVAVENPIPMQLAGLPKSDAAACPSWYGDKFTKKTLYWLRNLPPLFAGIDFPNAKSFVLARSGKYRSRTSTRLANALAEQWSNFILSEMSEREVEPIG